ncbi:MAG: T9SS type A sorting domain-containing protein [Bacteroidota bacterium]
MPVNNLGGSKDFNLQEPGTYYFTLASQKSGCDSLVQLNLDFSTSTEDLPSPILSTQLFPNPTRSNRTQLSIQTKKKTSIEIHLLDYTGKQLWAEGRTILLRETTIPIELPEVSGIYWVYLQTDSGEEQYFRVVNL